jgi:RNA polymerase sigma-70 factor, ECF subfamily
MASRPRTSDAPSALPAAETTLDLLARVHEGDEAALSHLIGRYLPGLRRWTSGRLPAWARKVSDTDDLVQETLIRAFQKLGDFDYRGEGALLAYLRQAILNRIRSEIRSARRRPPAEALSDDVEAPGPSPLEAAIGADAVEEYESALARLRPEEREAIVARIELGLTYAELAEVLGKPSPDAARMAVTRALVRFTEELRHARSGRSAG